MANTGDSYEALEFYGDSIIHFLVALESFCSFPYADSSELDIYKVRMVSNRVLASLGRNKGIDKVIIIGQ